LRARRGRCQGGSPVCPPATLMRPSPRRRAAQRTSRSARRIAIPRLPEPIPRYLAKCWRMPAPAPSLSGIPSGAPITARATFWSARRRSGLACRPHAIVCIGETQHQRDAGQTSISAAGSSYLAAGQATSGNLVVAYDRSGDRHRAYPTVGDVEQIHRFIRELLIARFSGEGMKMRILYGGSVKPSNAGN